MEFSIVWYYVILFVCFFAAVVCTLVTTPTLSALMSWTATHYSGLVLSAQTKVCTIHVDYFSSWVSYLHKPQSFLVRDTYVSYATIDLCCRELGSNTEILKVYYSY